MDNNVAAAKMEKIAQPLARPISPVKKLGSPSSMPPPLMVPTERINRGLATQIEAPEGMPGVNPTLMEKTNADDLIPTDPWETSPMFHELAQFFNVEPKFYEGNKDKISVITDWAIETMGTNKVEDIFHAIRMLEDNLYKPGWGETRLDTIYKYLRLAAHKSAADKALKAFEIGPMPGPERFRT